MKGKSSLKDVVRDMVKIDKKIPKCVSIRAGGKLYLGHPDYSGFLFLRYCCSFNCVYNLAL